MREWSCMVAALLAAVALPAVTGAATLYQWKDAAGVTHYTDNPMNVPPQYRNKSQRDVKTLETMKGGEKEQKEEAPTPEDRPGPTPEDRPGPAGEE